MEKRQAHHGELDARLNVLKAEYRMPFCLVV
jgi:hypothetical protein